MLYYVMLSKKNSIKALTSSVAARSSSAIAQKPRNVLYHLENYYLFITFFALSTLKIRYRTYFL